MNKHSLILIILFIPVVVYSGEYRLDRSQLREALSVHSETGTIISSNSGWYTGCSLLEALPLMEDVYRMEVHQGRESYAWDEDDLAEYWGESYLLQSGKNMVLLFKGKLYPNVTEILFEGIPMESTDLEIWLNWEGIDEIKDEISRFADTHGLSIHVLEVPKPESKLISVIRARGEVPDIVMFKSSSVESLVQARAIQNLDYVLLPDLLPQGKNAFTLKKKLWGIPFYFDTQIIFYNKKLITYPPEENWTLKGMEKIARSLKGKDVHPMVWNAYGSNWLIPFQMSFGKKRLLNRDGTITVFDQPTVNALNYLVGLKKEGLLVPMERDAMDALFIAGKVGMIISGSYAIPYFESLGLDFGVLSFPVNQETGIALAPLLDFKGFCVTRKSRSPILARRLLQYFIGAGVQQRFCPALAKLPVRSDVLAVPGISYGYLDVLEKTVDTGIVIPPEHVYSIYKNNMWKLLRFAVSGKMSVEQTLRQGQILMDNTIYDQR